ncbi:hypothetical protein Bca52824_022268 [Brassica carinata]|uniref:Uncharacterized protein n=1 Tax=Brassica carinata TaxID=52824 RepID=A0A8X7VG96_BRACI|nr:hypothetical protein Bca52824_022268 [Brassica carinata]
MGFGSGGDYSCWFGFLPVGYRSETDHDAVWDLSIICTVARWIAERRYIGVKGWFLFTLERFRICLGLLVGLQSWFLYDEVKKFLNCRGI